MSPALPREILLFEPSSLTASIIVSTARQMNLPRVRQVSSVRTAQQQLAAQGFGALILSLDEDDGAVALLEQVRNDQLAVHAQVPVAVTSAQVDPSTAVKMKALQVRRVLLKPFKVRDVIATIQMLDAGPAASSAR
jgi:DNA-binding response OmpR family regulator